jgi:hypothetical protein
MDTNSGLRGQAGLPPEWRETSDLRKHLTRAETPINKGPKAALSRAPFFPYAKRKFQPPSEKQTSGLEPGKQAQLIAAAAKAAATGYPINALLSVRWTGLLHYDDLHPLRVMKVPQRIRYVVELLRHWFRYRGLPCHYIWVRELSAQAGEHWHLALHLPKAKRKAFAGYLETLLVEPVAPCPRPQSKRTRGEFACSEWASWHLAGEDPDDKPQFEGYWLAAYLGKGEPSQRMFRGKLANNTLKPVRGREFGGYVRGGRYDEPQGHIEGTTTRKGRFDVARCLK